MTFKHKIFITLGLLTAGVASAAPVNCGAPPPPAQTVDSTDSISSFSLACGGLTFSNFEVIDAGATLPAKINLVSALHDSVTNMVTLTFNPNMYAANAMTEDLHFYFQVTGGITGIALEVSGTNSFVTERACSTPINGANNCTGGLSNQLAALTNFSGNSAAVATFNATFSPVYIYKDILADGRRSPNGAELTSFSQSFYTVPGNDSPVPEPLSMGLMGSGLIGLILWKKRAKA